MKRVFGVKKDKEPPPSIQDASDRINKRGDTVDEKIKKLDAELARYKEQIKKTRPGPAQEAVKARAMRVLKQKRMYEGQRDMLYNQTFNLDQVAFASEGIKDAQQTMSALKSANKELKGMMKTVKIQDIDNLQDEMMDLMDVSNEIQETLGRSYSVPEDIDEEELMGELDALEADMETEGDSVPSYLQPDKESDLDSEHHSPPPQPNPTFHHQSLTVAAAADETSNRSPASPCGGDRKDAIAPQPVSARPAAAAAGGGHDGASIEVIRRPRGRPPGSKNKPKPPVIITRDSEPSMSPYILEVPAGVDLVDSVTRFCRKHNMGLCVLNGSGTVSNVTLRQPSTTHGAPVTFPGRFDLLSISATVVPPNATFMYNGTGSAFTISLAGPQGQVVGGAVVGPLLSAGTVYLISATFNNPSYYRFPAEDETRNSGGGGSRGSDGRHASPQTAVSGGGEGSAAAPEPMYSGHLPSDVIWAPSARHPPPY